MFCNGTGEVDVAVAADLDDTMLTPLVQVLVEDETGTLGVNEETVALLLGEV